MDENEYKPVNIQDFFHGIDIEKLKETFCNFQP
jgi:hypothetical protein